MYIKYNKHGKENKSQNLHTKMNWFMNISAGYISKLDQNPYFLGYRFYCWSIWTNNLMTLTYNSMATWYDDIIHIYDDIDMHHV